jgi:peptide/nickel transport system substrate-binding protein
LGEDEITALAKEGVEALVSRTVSKPWRGEEYVPGKVSGTWRGAISADPKTFNLHLAEVDAPSAGIIAPLHDSLLDYDNVSRTWEPNCASAEIVTDQKAGTLSVVYTLRDDLYWSFYNSDRRVKVTSDDVVFWYDEIVGDAAFDSSGYGGQFIDMGGGERAHIDIEKLDDRRFAFHFPRVSADPLLSTNMDFGPRFIYEPAKQSGGAAGVEKVSALFSVNSDPREIPSMGRWFLIEYSPAQRLVYARNPAYWDRDAAGAASAYPEQMILSIVPDENTQYLQFQRGSLETASFRPENLVDAVNRAGAAYTVFNAEGSLGASLWSFNQNPANKDKPFYRWFIQKEVRQAMSCLLNRDRIIEQVYRGLGSPKYDFFPPPNPYYNPDITLPYRYDPARALSLLESAGFRRDGQGVLRDSRGAAMEFDLSIAGDSAIASDMASIIAGECEAVGIKVNVRQLDFQKLVDSLTRSFDWQSVFIGLGANYFPTQGSNVWPSTGNLHLWHPFQEKPATDWEARVDYLYNEGAHTINRAKAQPVWDEYQRIILEQCPVVYLVRGRAFAGVNNRWDFSNLYFDNVRSLQTERVWLR